MAKTKVVLADDHVVIAHGLSALLEEYFDLVKVDHDRHLDAPVEWTGRDPDTRIVAGGGDRRAYDEQQSAFGSGSSRWRFGMSFENIAGGGTGFGRPAGGARPDMHHSSRTAESHKYEIMKVLGVGTTTELVQYAIKTKLIGE